MSSISTRGNDDQADGSDLKEELPIIYALDVFLCRLKAMRPIQGEG
jgi:hypothetical protein